MPPRAHVGLTSHAYVMLTSREQVLDDFIFLSLLVGNDFLPHLPSLHIHEGAMDDLLEMYASSILTGVCFACVCSPFVFFSLFCAFI
eukprot:COSAG06_NODE_1365_length_9687_cov_14.601064_4_plen_87_part_00